MFRSLLLLFCALCTGSLVFAQALSPEDQAIKHALQTAEQAEYSVEDLSSLEIDYAYTDKKIGITYVYLQQQIGNLPIDGAIATVAFKNGEVKSFTHRFVDKVTDRLVSVVPTLTDADAMSRAANSIGERMPAVASRAATKEGPQGQRMYTKTEFTNGPVAVEDFYHLGKDGKLRRSIGVTIDHTSSSNNYRIAVEASTGVILETYNRTIHCSFGHDFLGAHVTGACDEAPAHNHASQEAPTVFVNGVNDGSQYRVFPWPAESPNHGTHSLVVSPADSIASPFGWHDTDGMTGPEYTITRGNNVHAYLDRQDTDSPSDPEPDGGSSLVFDYPYDVNVEPADQPDATVTNLFYVVNQIHDFSAAYGFDEAGGNFQATNYSGDGRGGDHVFGQSQDGAQILNGLPDADHINNANFATPADGSSGRMQMYLWNANNQGNVLTVAGPSTVGNQSFGDLGLPGDGWGNVQVDSTTNIVAPVIDVVDVLANTSLNDGCEELVNSDDVAGKIALVDRGTCEFGSKAFRAQNAGAVAVIICNFEDPAAGMLGGVDGGDVDIPTFMLGLSGCQTIRALAQQFPDFELQIKQPEDQPTTFVSGSYDNGIIAHEFGHGISNRLTAGPNQAGCLGNATQMGEGWSDFFTLVTSRKTGHTPEMRRGIGTFAQREDTTGGGIRNFPYSTDMGINPVTFADVANSDFSQPHGIGSIWCSMLWDLYWAMEEKHGYDPDQFHGTGGNNMAIQLVMTSMKLQPCNPGFQDGRDAILAADQMLYNGDNERLIWEVFARRGLGFDADQGDPDDRFDGTSNFQIPPALANTSFFAKVVTPEVEAGGTVDVTLTYANWLDSSVVASSVITDILPEGATLLGSSVNQPFTQNGDVISFEFTDLEKGDTVIINYSFETASTQPDLLYYQPISEDGEESDWLTGNLVDEVSNGAIFFEIFESDNPNEAYLDGASWYAEGTLDGSQPYFAMEDELAVPISGDVPVFSFFTRYDLDPTFAGGIVEIFDEDSNVWVAISADKFLRNGYTNRLVYQAFVIPFLDGFAGNQNEWQRVLIDMSDWAGETVKLRWRYGRQDNQGSTLREGWYVDEMAFIDAIMYNTEASLTVDGGDPIVVTAPDVGTFITNGFVVSTDETPTGIAKLQAFPNPTTNDVTLMWDASLSAGEVQIFDGTGKLLSTQVVQAGVEQYKVALSSYPSGLYSIRTVRGNTEQTVRIVKQ